MTPKRRLRAVPLLLALIVLACSQGLRPPDVAPSGTLDLTELDPDDVDHGPLRVVYASPKGALRGPSEITVLFSKPMRALELAGSEAPFPGSPYAFLLDGVDISDIRVPPFVDIDVCTEIHSTL